jgi:hypothetical protein
MAFYYTDQDKNAAVALSGRWEAFYTMLGQPRPGGFDLIMWPTKLITAARAKGLSIKPQFDAWEAYRAAFMKSEADPNELQARAQDLASVERQADEKGLYSFEIDVGNGKERRNAPPSPPALQLAPHPADRVMPKIAQEVSDAAAKIDKGKIGPGVMPPPDTVADVLVRVGVVGGFVVLAWLAGRARVGG